MEVTILDFVLINCIAYIGGIGTGVLICCQYKDNFMIRSRSRDNLSQTNNLTLPNTMLTSSPAIMASAPPSHNPIKITLE
jgi:hypothetical protein